ncbi:cache domain-containing protein [Candidatus Nitrosocosmicus franklandus]|uniref:cache domain-containing protein n=1 Tax=Candidatus Nitrosocosmicus franklandianus TaxID=1798806 RepID=UPI0015593B60|nr:cache domain-containing protein [Candidatus Nitrosocosmicus franklandus]
MNLQRLFANSFENNTALNDTHSSYAFTLDLFAELVEDRIRGIIDILEFTSKDKTFSTISYLSNITDAYHGIASNLETDKRQVLDYILKINPDIASIYFVLPNGDIYLGEPYRHQEQLPRLNFADREWYVGVTTLNETYVSSIFLSASINAPAFAIAVPVSTNSDVESPTLNSGEVPFGYLVGIVNLKLVHDLVSNVTSNNIGDFFVIDKNGTQLFNSSDTGITDNLKKFHYIEGISYNTTQLVNANHTVISELNNTLLLSKPIAFKNGHLIAILVTENK